MGTELIAPRGLKGLKVAETTVGDVRGDEGFYHYRQYDATELAAKRSVEDVWALLIDGALPAPGDTAFAAEVAPLRAIPRSADAAVDAIALIDASPMGRLRAALAAVTEADGPTATYDQSASERRATALRVAALVPTVLARLWRVGQGLGPIGPDPTMGHAADYLRMVMGTEPTDDQVRLVTTYLVTTVDHGFNASTFSTRVTVSTGTDIGGAVSAGLAALAGPLHGGAPSRVLDLLDEIGEPGRAAAWVDEQLARGDKVMGFGHPVYRTGDPRSRVLRRVAETVGGPLLERAVTVEAALHAALKARRPDLDLSTNVEWYAAVVMSLAGLPPELFTPTFAVGRVIGWTAHALEQAADGKILRPSATYVGPPPPVPVP